MMETEREQHWNNVYATKLPNQVSWTQAIPTIALNYFQLLQLNKQASIIDIGGGESTLVDFLVEQGFENITVLDISTIAIQKVKQRLGDKAKKINWIVTDILNFKPTQKYDVWHDRATFHFLTNHEHINKYVSLVNDFVTKHLIVSTFSTNGPNKCSGLQTMQYSADSLAQKFNANFKLMHHQLQQHQTPFNTTQNFLYGCFNRIK